MSGEPNPEDLPNLLTNPEALNWAITMFENQVRFSKTQKEKMQNEIKALDDSIYELEDKLTILKSYKEFMDLKGFHTMKQTVEAHQDEIKQAQKERVKQKTPEQIMQDLLNNNNFNFQFHGTDNTFRG